MGKQLLTHDNIMNRKSLKKYIGISLLLIMGTSAMIGCSNKNISNETTKSQETINYTKVEVGELEFELVDEGIDENKFVRQWILDNKETEGLYTKLFEGNTYVLYAMGEKTHYGYGVNSINIVKEEEDSPIVVKITTSEPDLSFAKESINYPYIAVKIKGNIKDEFKEEVLTPSDIAKQLEEALKEENENKKENENKENTTNEAEKDDVNEAQ